MQKMSAFIALSATSGAAIPVARSLRSDSFHTEYVPNRSIAKRRSFGVMRATEQPHHPLCRSRGQSCEPGVCSSDFLNPPLNQVWPRLHPCPGGSHQCSGGGLGLDTPSSPKDDLRAAVGGRGGGSNEGLWISIAVAEVFLNRSFEFGNAFEGTAPHAFSGDVPSPGSHSFTNSFILCRWRDTSMVSLRSSWDSLSLVRQFALMACIVVGTGMMVLGAFVSAEIEADVVHNAAAETALYVSSFNATYLEELTTGTALSEEAMRMLDASFTRTELGRQIISVKIWQPDGHVVYSTIPDFISSTSWTNPSLRKALKGEVSAQFGNPADDPDAIVRGLSVSLLKIYVPIHSLRGDHVVAAAEFFTRADGLKADLKTARLDTWIAVSGIGLVKIVLLYGIVWRGNKTIESQRAVLVDARRASIETSERFLRRIGAELHDGPAQLIGLALLRLDALRPPPARDSQSEVFEKIRTVLQDCLREIRHLSAGLAPPHLDNLAVGKVLELAVRQHEQRSGSIVHADIGVLPAKMSSLHKVCIYRVVQEGLNNAYRHAAGIGQTVHAFSDGDELVIEVVDKGPGFSSPNKGGSGLGLAGLRDRVETLGGKFSLETELGSGTRLRASFELASTGAKDA